MQGGLYLRVLGPVVAERDGMPLAVGGPQRRAVLSLLALDVNRFVSVDRLAHSLWGDLPPRSFRVQLQGAVSHLRRVLGEGGERSTAPIETRASGYRLRLPAEQIDLEQFQLEVATARRGFEEGDFTTARNLLRAALSRWRGPAFDGVDCPPVRDVVAALEETYLGAVEDRVETDIVLGHEDGVIAELRVLVERYPWRERFRGQLMRALAHDGRLADALAAYRDAREQTVRELGVEPSIQLQQLHRALLTGLSSPHQADAPSALPYLVPRQLPADVGDLFGRADIAKQAMELLGGERNRVAITGAGGVGKSSLAVHVARRSRATFPDGQLYARLGGSSGVRVSTAAVQAQFLHALGVPPGGVPAGESELDALYRELLSTRRLLIVLDDAADEAQVRPLLSVDPRCAVLLTSRRRLTGLDAVAQFPLDVLSVEDGLALLHARVSSDRFRAEPSVAAAVVRHCGGLPLAIRIAGDRLASRSNWSVADMATRLGAARDRLDWLQLGDVGVRATFEESYRTLSVPQQRLFRRLALLPRDAFPAWLAGALLDDHPGRAERVLDELVDVHLVEPATRGVAGPRYRMHDLMYLLAGELAEDEAPAERASALRRVLEGWLDLAATADGELPHWHGLDPEPQPHWRAPRDIHRVARAHPFSWFDEERSALVEAVRQATGHGFAQLAWPLAQRLSTYLDVRGRYEEWAVVGHEGLRAAEHADDLAGTACMLGLLVDAEASRDRFPVSMDYAARTLDAYRRLASEQDDGSGWTPGDDESRSGTDVREHGREQGLATADAAGDMLAAGRAAFMRAKSSRDAGIHEDFLALFEEARAAFRASGARLAEMWTLKNIGLTHLRHRRLDEAAECLLRGADIVTAFPDTVFLPDMTADIVMTYLAQGGSEQAASLAAEALEHARLYGNRWDEGRALDTIVDLRRASGEHRAARDVALEALTVWRQLGASSRVASATCAAAELSAELGDTAGAARYRAQHDAMAGELGENP